MRETQATHIKAARNYGINTKPAAQRLSFIPFLLASFACPHEIQLSFFIFFPFLFFSFGNVLLKWMLKPKLHRYRKTLSLNSSLTKRKINCLTKPGHIKIRLIFFATSMRNRIKRKKSVLITPHLG